MTLNVRDLSFASLMEDMQTIIVEGCEEGWPYGEIMEELVQIMKEYEVIEA